MPHTARRHFDGGTAARQGEQRVHRHRERVADARGRDRNLNRRLVEVSRRLRIVRRHVDLDRRRLAAAGVAVARDGRHRADERHLARGGRVVGERDRDRIADLDLGLLRRVELNRHLAASRRERQHRARLYGRADRRRDGRYSHRPGFEDDRAGHQRAGLREPVLLLERLDPRSGLAREGVAAETERGVQFGDVRARRHAGAKRPPLRHRAVEQNHRLAVDPVERVSLPDDVAQLRQPRVGAAGAGGRDDRPRAGVTERRAHLRLRRERPPPHGREPRRSGVVDRRGRAVGTAGWKRERRDRRGSDHDHRSRGYDDAPAHGAARCDWTLPGRSFWQAFCAAWKTGERGSIPLEGPIRNDACPPENCGSGNFGTPCARMQAENLSAWACIFACSAGLGGCPPVGGYFRQAFCAFWKAGESGLTPFNVTLPLAEGSGKFDTPCERMHDANLRIAATLPPTIVKLPPPPPLVPPPPDGGDSEEDLFVVVDPAPATARESGLLPHPEAAAARASAESETAPSLSAFMLIIPFVCSKMTAANRDSSRPVTTRGRLL